MKKLIFKLSYLASDLGFVANTINVLFQMYCSKKMHCILGFASSSAGKEPACKAGNLSPIPGLGRFPGEGIGYPLKYSWASLVAQLVKNLPAMQETPVEFPGWEDSLEKG